VNNLKTFPNFTRSHLTFDIFFFCELHTNTCFLVCGIIVLFDIALIIIYGILIGILISGTPAAVASSGVVVWIGIVLLLVPIISLMLFGIEFVLLVKHSRLAVRPPITGDYVRVTAA